MADLLYINSADPPSKQATDINYNFSVVESGGESTVTSADITDATTVGRSVLTAASAAAARTAIGAGTSNLTLGTTASTALAGNTALLTIGTTATTAKAGNYQPTAANISDATAVGRSVLTAADAAAARTAIGAGTSSLTIGTTSTTAKAGDYQPTWAQVSGKPTTFAPVAATATVVGGVKTATAPVITITDPADYENIQAAFDSLVAALKLSGVLT